MTEHSATPASAAAAQFVPVGKKVLAAMAAEWSATRMSLIVTATTVLAAVAERVGVMVLMHGVKKEMAQVHG
ncbi:hypothetical protein ACPPVV_06570 [Rhodanobacter sp. Col0626]|uniref:hypothetical protein n=1 Tax=Rhodanobacter sp. Col0626 TaxID=3415679 RepID=UPI003CE75E97